MIVDSRLDTGRFGLGGTEWSPDLEIGCQLRAVRLVPSHDEVGSDVTTWCGRTIPATVRTRWELALDGLQDWDTLGLTIASYLFHGSTQTFVWQPSKDSETWTGRVRVTALPIGGPVNRRLTVGFSWPLEGAPSIRSGAQPT